MAAFPVAGYIANAGRTHGDQKVALEDFLAATKQIPGAGIAETTLTIASGSVTPPSGGPGIFKIDTEAGAASDDLTNIIQTNVPDGSLLLIRCANAARAVNILGSAGGAGQIIVQGSQTIVLNDTKQWVLLKRTGATWEEIFSPVVWRPLLKEGSVTADPQTLQGLVGKQYADEQSWVTPIKNLTLVASVASNALTVAIKTKAGTDASATDPIVIGFRNPTAASGDKNTRTLQAGSSVTASSGSTLDTVSGIPSRIYVGIADDAGTLRPFLFNPLDSTLNLLALDEAETYASTAEGGAGAADSAQVLYSGTAFSGKAIRILGYVESTQATAGTWVTSPSKVQVMGPGIKRTGDIVKRRFAQTGAVATGTTTTPDDDTIPQITEGNEFMTVTLTANNAINLVAVAAQAFSDHSAGGTICLALHVDAVANALAATRRDAGTEADGDHLTWVGRAGTVNLQTFRARIGSGSAGTVTFNGTASARKYGGVMNSYLHATEIMV